MGRNAIAKATSEAIAQDATVFEAPLSLLLVPVDEGEEAGPSVGWDPAIILHILIFFFIYI